MGYRKSQTPQKGLLMCQNLVSENIFYKSLDLVIILGHLVNSHIKVRREAKKDTGEDKGKEKQEQER